MPVLASDPRVRTSRPGVRTVGVVLAAGLVLGACSDDGGQAASAFNAEVPDGYRLVAEGPGENSMLWGSDTDGYSTGGFTVLARSDETEDPAELTVVEVTGFQGFEGGLSQALDGYPSTTSEEVEVDGRRALLADLGDDITQLVAERDRDLAISAQSATLEGDELADLISGTELAYSRRRNAAPEVDPPEGWEVLGEATNVLTIALGAFSHDGYTGGPASAESKAWRAPDGSQILTVLTVPASAGDLEAALGYSLTNGGDPALETDRFELEGRPAVWVASNSSRGTLVTTTDWGDLLVARSAPDGVNAEPPDRRLLESVAASVTRA